jgi:hypothetical protein
VEANVESLDLEINRGSNGLKGVTLRDIQKSEHVRNFRL